MSESEKNVVGLSRARVFVAGAIVTGVLSGLIVMCIPSKPDLLAEAAKPQSVPESVVTVAGGTDGATQAAAQGAAQDSAGLRTGTAGERLYTRYCAGCHGADGKASTSMARMMTSRPTNLSEEDWKGPRTEEAIITIVTQGKGAMPAYGKEITDPAELKSLAEYVLSLRSGSGQ